MQYEAQKGAKPRHRSQSAAGSRSKILIFISQCMFSSSKTSQHGSAAMQSFRLISSISPRPSQARAPKLLVSEIFRSIQGEGPHTGRPSLFLRLGVCNLSCIWCDTPYTWLFSESKKELLHTRSLSNGLSPPDRVYNRSEELSRSSVKDIAEHLFEIANGARAVVITGGEPMLHAKPLTILVPQLIDRGFEIEFETNGTIRPVGLPHSVHLNVSPKLSNSLIPKDVRLRYDVLEECLAFPSSVLKFVVGGEEDLREVSEIVNTVAIEHERVYLMPLGTDSSTIRERGRWLVDVCVDKGFNYSHRVHVELWGDKRGV